MDIPLPPAADYSPSQVTSPHSDKDSTPPPSGPVSLTLPQKVKLPPPILLTEEPPLALPSGSSSLNLVNFAASLQTQGQANVQAQSLMPHQKPATSGIVLGPKKAADRLKAFKVRCPNRPNPKSDLYGLGVKTKRRRVSWDEAFETNNEKYCTVEPAVGEQVSFFCFFLPILCLVYRRNADVDRRY